MVELNGEIDIPYGLYMEIENINKKKPLKYLISHSTYSCICKDGFVSVECEYQIRVFDTKERGNKEIGTLISTKESIQLISQQSTILESTIKYSNGSGGSSLRNSGGSDIENWDDGETVEASILTSGEYYYLHIGSAGRYYVKLLLSTPYLTSKEAGMNLPIPQCSNNSVFFSVPHKDANIKIFNSFVDQSNSSLISEKLKLLTSQSSSSSSSSSTSKTTAFVKLANEKSLKAQWTVNDESNQSTDVNNSNNYSNLNNNSLVAPKVISKPNVTVIQNNLCSIGEGLLSMKSHFDYKIIAGTLSLFNVEIENNINIVNVQGIAIKKWEVLDKVNSNSPSSSSPSSGFNRIIQIQLDYGIENSYKLLIASEYSMKDTSGELSIPSMRCMGEEISRQRGFLGVEARTNVEISDIGNEGLSVVDLKELPHQIRSMANHPILLSYKFLEPQFKLALKVKRNKDCAVLVSLVESMSWVTTVSYSGKMIHQMVLLIKNTQKQFLKIQMPWEYEIWSTIMDGEPIKPSIGDSDQQLLIPILKPGCFDQNTPIKVEVVILQKKLHRFNNGKGKFNFVVPKIDLPLQNIFCTVYLPPCLASNCIGNLKNVESFSLTPPSASNISANSMRRLQNVGSYSGNNDITSSFSKVGFKSARKAPVQTIFVEIPTTQNQIKFQQILLSGDKDLTFGFDYKLEQVKHFRNTNLNRNRVQLDFKNHKTDQYDCLYSLFLKYNSLAVFSNDKSDPSKLDFCNSTGIDCEGGNKIKKLSLEGGINILSNEKQLVLLDIFCLPDLSQLSIKSMNISDEVLYDKMTEYYSLTIINVTGDTFKNGITRQLPSLIFLNIESNKLENTILKFSLIGKISNLKIEGSFIYLENDLSSENNLLSYLKVNALNYPDFSNFKILGIIDFNFNDNFLKDSVGNVSTIQSLESMSISNTIPLEFNFNLCPNVKKLAVKGPLSKPSGYIDLTKTIFSYLYLGNPTDNFNVDGNLPLLLPENTYFTIYNSTFKNVPSNLKRGIDSLTMIYETIFLNSTLPKFTGSGFTFIYPNNNLIGTIDESWCETQLSVDNNQLEGSIPSCFTCYFKDNETYLNGNVFSMFERFRGNKFTNYDKTIECTTFEPIVTIDRSNGNNNEIILSGKDIGFNYKNWLYNNKVMNLTKTNKVGKSYTLSIDEDLSLLDFIPIHFIYPNNQTLYFPIKDKLFTISSVITSKVGIIDNNINNLFLIQGSFFSTYKGYIKQSVQIQGIDCMMNFQDFFHIDCITNQTISLIDSNFKKLTINSGSFSKSVLINITDGAINQKNCKNDCNGVNGICNLFSGNCICNEYQWLGEDCSIPYHYISSVDVPTTTPNGISSFSGNFGDTHTNLSITIGNLPCDPIYLISTNIITCIEPIGSGTKLAIITQNGVNASIIYNYYQANKPCPSNCSNHGTCNNQTGECKCNSSYKGFDCSILIDNGSGSGGPPTNSTVNENTGGTDISNQDTQFKIYFKSLVEVDFNGNPIIEYKLLDNWKSIKTNDKFKYKLTQKLNNTQCEVISNIEEIQQIDGKQFTFANLNFKLDQGSIKFSLNIVNYTYQNNLNTLRLDLISSVEQINYKDNECNEKETLIDPNNNDNNNNLSSFNYIKISKNNKILNGRFINKVVSDGKVTFLSTTIKNDSNSITISLNLPHCTNECIIDPDFSLLVDMKSYESCSNENKREAWFLPVVIVIPTISLALLVILVFIIYKRSTVLKIKIHKLKRINKKT
ncbi:hypothetical protein ACTFIY_000097 [Dictyostelium cf. discoideum]